MFTHSECEISQSWRTLFSSHGAFNLNRADMPLLPLHPAWRSSASGRSRRPALKEMSLIESDFSQINGCYLFTNMLLAEVKLLKSEKDVILNRKRRYFKLKKTLF